MINNQLTAEEIAFIKKNYKNMTQQQIANTLNISKPQVQYQCQKLKLSKAKPKTLNIWTEEQIQYLKDHYQEESRRLLAIHTNQSENNVRTQLIKLQLVTKEKKKNSVNIWTKEKDLYIKEHFIYDNTEDIAKYLQVSNRAVVNRACRLGIKKEKWHNWSEQDINYLINNYACTDKYILMDILHRNWNTIQAKASLLNLSRGRYFKVNAELINKQISQTIVIEQYKYDNVELSNDFNRILMDNDIWDKNITINNIVWTDIKIRFLTINYNRISILQLSNFLQCSQYCICKKMKELNLIKTLYKQHNCWTYYEEQILINTYNNIAIDYINLLLPRRTRESIQSKAKKLKLLTPIRTQIELITEQILIDNHIPFEIQQRFYFNEKLYILDFLINDNIGIECNGDYWHANPKIYQNDKLDKIQIKSRLRDIHKKLCFESIGISIIYLWEYDLYNNKQKCIDQILNIYKEINKNG